MPSALEKLFAPARLAGLTLRNRVIKTATFAGMCPGGVPGEELIELRHPWPAPCPTPQRPDLSALMRRDQDHRSACTHCNLCAPAGWGCLNERPGWLGRVAPNQPTDLAPRVAEENT